MNQGTPIALAPAPLVGRRVLFGIGAVLAIGRDPANSATNFAWPIQPVVMAATLGAFYITSAPLFLLPLFAKRWKMIRAMILPAALFSTVQLAATFLHWDKFSIGTIPFYVWFASYLLPPPIFVAASFGINAMLVHGLFLLTIPSPPGFNLLLILCGGLLTLIAVLTFFFPGFLIPVFPWQLTPLTARSLSGWLIAVGTIMLWMSRENNRTRVRLATPMLILLLPALLMQVSRFAEQVNWDSPILWIGFLLFAIVGFCGVHIANGSWRGALN